MGSCFSFPPKFDLKPPLESWQRSLPLSRVFPSSSAAHAMLSHGWGWQSHLGNITCVLPSRKLLAPPDPRAEGLGFTSLEQHPYYFHSWFKYLSWLARVPFCVILGFLGAACMQRTHLLGRSPSITPIWKFHQSLLLFHCSDDCNLFFWQGIFSFLQQRMNPYLLAGHWSSIINHLYSGATC